MLLAAGAVVHTFNLSIWEAEAGESLWVQGQPGLIMGSRPPGATGSLPRPSKRLSG